MAGTRRDAQVTAQAARGTGLPGVSGRQLLTALGTWVVSSAAVGAGTYAGAQLVPGLRHDIDMISSIIVFEVYLLLIIAVVMGTGGWQVARDRFGLVRPQRWQLAFTAKMAVVMFAAAAAWYGVSLLIGGTLAEQQREQLLFIGLDGERLIGAGPLLIVLSVLRGVVVTPVAEELFFRGALYSWLKRRFSIRVAIVASTALFTVVHFGVLGVAPHVFIGGLAIALVRERTGSVVPGMLVHCVTNAIIFVAAYLITGWTAV
jgi:CAAX protease family protein